MQKLLCPQKLKLSQFFFNQIVTKILNVTKITHTNCSNSKIIRLWLKSINETLTKVKTQVVTKLQKLKFSMYKFVCWQNSKYQILTNIKTLNGDKLWPNLNNQI